ncbi:alpha/beta hydrolase [Seonamhaeicola marinus]|uniref:Alpha/beta hydrolase n=1 Tax=Seonamhaeicola marinus TaxID=1912246 RepID=A0A5D0I4Z7_9FLAO|nr:alpha/beta hydrolase [Seonamhaeicola marinus]TYA78438.1 alpha/beta hydrolase [Seonamhaeicola marinus]
MKTKTIFLSFFYVVFSTFFLPVFGQKRPDVSEFVPQYVTVTKDIPYVTYGNRTLLLDLYKPNTYKKNLATIVIIRGGGFRIGDKNGFAPMAAAFAKEGFATICIEYRTIKEALFPAAIKDSKMAVRWIHEHAKTYDLDVNRIGVIGGSAGAHLSMMLGVSGDVTALNPDLNSKLYKVHAAVVLEADADFSTATDDKNLIDWLGVSYSENRKKWELASPIYHIDDTDPPMLFIHGVKDHIVPIEQSLNSVELLIKNNVYSELIALPSVGHGFWGTKKWFDFTIGRATLFFKEQLQF